MALNIRLLGVGGGFAMPPECHTSALVWEDGSKPVLLDCGYLVPAALAGLTIGSVPAEPNLAAVLITHAHADHIGGIETLALRRFYIHRAKTPLKVLSGHFVNEDIHRALNPGLCNYIDWGGIPQHNGTCNRGEKTTREGRLVAIGEPTSLHGASLHIAAQACTHVPGMNAVSFLLTDITSKRSIFWSGDHIFDALCLKLVSTLVDLIFWDCCFYRKYPGTVHTHLEELLTLPKEIQERVVLIHHGQDPATITAGHMEVGHAGKHYELR